MTPKRWQRVNEVFHSALERAPGQRADFLSQVCAGDEELRREVESLIRSHQQIGSFIDAPEIEVAAEVMYDDQTELTVGQAISHYKILRMLGAGGMGRVYLAQDNLLNRKVAIKLLPNALTKDPQMRARFIREAQLASALDHSNICTIHEVGESNGQHFIVMQYVEGETLKRLVGNRPLRFDALIPISLQLADALSAAHAQGIIHRDIKPSNIIITSRGQTKVLDFGLAKLLEAKSGEGEAGLTQTGAMLGTPSYMSPEQARGAHVDHRSDIFSLGAVIYEMATGRVAFQGKSHAETMNAVINEPHKPAAELNKEVPAALSAVIDRSLAKETKHRYQSMEELISDLRQVAQGFGITSSSVPAILPRRHGLIGNLWPANRLASLQARKTERNPTDLSEKKRHAPFFWVTVILAPVLVVAAGLYVVGKLESRQAYLAARPLTTDPGFEGMPSFSPDGKYVAFIAGGGELQKDFDLYVKQIGGSQPLRLTSGPAVEEFPAWSPDSSSIAFVRHKGDKLDVVLIPPIGGPERKVAEVAAPDESQSIFSWNPPYLSWTADSKYLVTTDRLSSGEPYGLVVLSVATGEKRQLTRPPQAQNDGNPDVSPDGRTLANCARHLYRSTSTLCATADGRLPTGRRGAASRCSAAVGDESHLDLGRSGDRLFRGGTLGSRNQEAVESSSVRFRETTALDFGRGGRPTADHFPAR
jgi:eukaryotic-like serine/threonine-protein kinase